MREQSKIKTAIVSKYFDAWSKVMIGVQNRNGRQNNRLNYIDLFAGPGRYKDGTKSTPLLILEMVIANPVLRERLYGLFNDVDTDNSNSLAQAISELPDIESLAYGPVVMRKEVGTEIVKQFEDFQLDPTLIFVDPWGYKGLSLRLVNSVLKDFGCDCIFFFNYTRINMAVTNKRVASHIEDLFGEELANQLRKDVTGASPQERESLVLEHLAQALKNSEEGKRFVLPFRFRNDRDTRTTHHLIFVSKGFLGYEIMKGIMARQSSEEIDGVCSFEYVPAQPQLSLLYALSRPLENLAADLLCVFAGQTLTMREIYLRHNVDTPYISANYKDALVAMELDGQITIEPPHSKRQKRLGKPTCADAVKVSFPNA
ncbi:MAG: three-Cys-motif partner protein TcmP [Proteobacteria bacterium]|nr:MAG: three-Cys-motif partner protein TcmP [Pseudomonadota bacterium]